MLVSSISSAAGTAVAALFVVAVFFETVFFEAVFLFVAFFGGLFFWWAYYKCLKVLVSGTNLSTKLFTALSGSQWRCFTCN